MSETFAFGANWPKFLQLVNDERIDLAIRSIQRLTGKTRLEAFDSSTLDPGVVFSRWLRES